MEVCRGQRDEGELAGDESETVMLILLDSNLEGRVAER